MDHKNVYIQFGLFVKAARERKGLYQKDVASRVGISSSYYCQIENGTRQATLTVALDICETLNLDFGDFLKTMNHKQKA